MVNPLLVSVLPRSNDVNDAAVRNAGGQPVPLSPEVGAIVWTDYTQPQALVDILHANPQITWVQLPWAGVDAFGDLIRYPVRFTCAKGAYREPVAEHALMLSMALARKVPDRVRANSWGEKFAVSLYDSKVTVVGGGGITEELLRLLAPFRAEVTVVRNRAVELTGAYKTVTLTGLDGALATADFVIIACSLTEDTRGLFDAARLRRMKPEAYLVNVARGPIVVTQDLLTALDQGVIAGAAVDVTDPEPLPEGHPAWDNPKLLITPHTADTPRQVRVMFAARVEENVRAYLGKSEWVGQVNPDLGY